MKNEICFSLKDNKCSILYEKICKEKKCKFFKTKEKFLDDKNKVEEYNLVNNINCSKYR